MDVNEALRRCREASAAIDAGQSGEAVELAHHFDAIDQWLTKGGFLPAAWQHGTPAPGTDAEVLAEDRMRRVSFTNVHGERWALDVTRDTIVLTGDELDDRRLVLTSPIALAPMGAFGWLLTWGAAGGNLILDTAEAGWLRAALRRAEAWLAAPASTGCRRCGGRGWVYGYDHRHGAPCSIDPCPECDGKRLAAPDSEPVGELHTGEMSVCTPHRIVEPCVTCDRDRLAAEVARLTAKLQNEAIEHGEAMGQLRRANEGRDAALRERDEARQLALQAHAADEREGAARRWAAEQFRAWIISPDCGTSQFAERLERGPQPAEEE